MNTLGTFSTILLSLSLASVTSCSKQPDAGNAAKTSSAKDELAAQAAPAKKDTAEKPVAAKPPMGGDSKKTGAGAQVGSPAPDFTLKDLAGKEVSLGSFKGKTVVLEWFNPDCPFVQRAHTKGSLVNTAKTQAESGVVWLAINSGAEGRQGHGIKTNTAGKAKFKLEHPILLDEDGTVGKAYGATNTPHIFVIDQGGVLAYRGAVDNSPDGERESPTGGKLVSYVDEALAALKAGKPVATTQTEAYGCSVKYAKNY